MSYKTILLIVCLTLLLMGYVWYESSQPAPLSWEQTYSAQDKIPYGTYILYQSLPHLFPSSEIRVSKITLVNQLEKMKAHKAVNYLFINRKFDSDPVEVHRLLDWIKKGNNVFIAAERISDTLLSLCSLKLSPHYSYRNYRFTRPEYANKDYQCNIFSNTCFILDTNFRGQVLGQKDSLADFVRLPLENGNLFLNLNPGGFTNIGILDEKLGDYYYKALSYLPDQGSTVVWDEYKILSERKIKTPLRVLLSFPALKGALYLLLLGSLLYALFRIKREQRPIPVIQPYKNRTLEFIAAVSSLYFKQKDHSAIAKKGIHIFMDKVRTHYQLRTDHLDERFITMLSERSGVEWKDTEDLITFIVKVNEAREVDETLLRQLVKKIEKFERKE